MDEQRHEQSGKNADGYAQRAFVRKGCNKAHIFRRNFRHHGRKHIQSEEQEAEPHKGFAQRLFAQPFERLQYVADAEHRNRKGGNVKTEAEKRHNPGGNGGADVCAENDAHRLLEGHQSGIDEGHNHHRGGAG